MLLKQNENAAGRVAGLELGGEWVVKKVLLCASFICFQGIIENWLEGGGRCGSRVSGHDGIVGDGDRKEQHRLARSGHPVTR